MLDLFRPNGLNGAKGSDKDSLQSDFSYQGKSTTKRVIDMDDEVSAENGSPEKPEVSLDLNFLPTWARKPPENPYTGREGAGGGGRGREGPGRRDDRRGGFGSRPGQSRSTGRPGGGFQSRPGGGARPGGGSRPGGALGNSRPGGGFPRPRRDADRRDPRREGGGGRRPPRPFQPRLDVRISFLPDRERLALVVQDIQASRRAFPLIQIANRFLSRDDLYLVKLELPAPAEGAERQTFVQCLECRRVFRSRANAEAHILKSHLEKFFTIEETEVEPPKGTFTCVARCRLSGVLLGPSNHHGYNEKIQEIWSSRFPQMSKAEYLGNIETVRDEALVEKWKESLCKKTVYRLKDLPEGEEAEAMTQAQACEWARGGKINSLLRESARCMVPGLQSKQFEDGSLRQAMSLAWQKESRFPFTLSLALRPAFRHMHLNLFKVNAKETYVTAVLPKPVELETAPAVAREIVAHLEANPGQARQQVLEGLRAGADAESTEAAEVLLHLGNLIANGGVIEFFNGTLSLPRGGARPDSKPARKPKSKTGEDASKAKKEKAALESSAPADENKEAMPPKSGEEAAPEPEAVKAEPVPEPEEVKPEDVKAEAVPEPEKVKPEHVKAEAVPEPESVKLEEPKVEEAEATPEPSTPPAETTETVPPTEESVKSE